MSGDWYRRIKALIEDKRPINPGGYYQVLVRDLRELLKHYEEMDNVLREQHRKEHPEVYPPSNKIDLDIARRSADFCVLTEKVDGATIHPRNMIIMMADELELLRGKL